MLGGGRKNFLPNTEPDVEYPNLSGTRPDSRNLIEEWEKEKSDSNLKHEYVWNASQFYAVDTDNVDYLLGEQGCHFTNIKTKCTNETSNTGILSYI